MNGETASRRAAAYDRTHEIATTSHKISMTSHPTARIVGLHRTKSIILHARDTFSAPC